MNENSADLLELRRHKAHWEDLMIAIPLVIAEFNFAIQKRDTTYTYDAIEEILSMFTELREILDDQN